MRLVNAIRTIVACVLTLLVGVGTAEASHYRGGDMWATIGADGVVTLTAVTRWRKDFSPLLGIDPSRFGQTSFSGGVTGCPGFTTPVGQGVSFKIVRVSDGATVYTWNATPFPASVVTSLDTTPANYTQVVQQLKIPLGATTATNQINLPLGLAFGTYDIVWNDWARIPGIRNIDPVNLCSGNDAGFSLKTRVQWNGAANGSPQVNSTFAAAVARSFDYSQNLNATDPEGDSITYRFAGGNPPNALYPDFAGYSRVPGLTLSQAGQLQIPAASTGSLLDNAFAGQVVSGLNVTGGDYLIKVEIEDSKGAISQRDALIDALTSTNHPPAIDPIGNRTIDVGTTVTFTVRATDADAGQGLTLSATGLPSGSSFPTKAGGNTGVTQTFTWTPTTPGTFSIKFDATDAGTAAAAFLDKFTTSQQVTLTVQSGNRPPALQTIANARVGADPLNATAFESQTISFEAFATDPNSGDTLTYSAPVLVNPSGANVPLTALGVTITNLILDPVHVQYGHVTVTPGPEDVGVWQLRVRVDDGLGGTDEANVFISVGTVANQSPTFSTAPVQDVITTAGSLLSFPVVTQDPNSGQTVKLTTTGRPAGSTFNEGVTGNPVSATFSWTPPTGQTGDFTVNFDATDNGSPNIALRGISRIHVVNACPAAPRIIKVVPASGLSAGGTNVTLYGQGFCNAVSVKIGDNLVQNLTVVSGVQLTFDTPPGIANTAADVVVTTSDGTATLADGFWYFAKFDQSINFPPIGLHGIDDAPFTPVATATSDLPVSFSLVSGPATMTGGTLTITGLGSITVRASQPGNGVYEPAQDVEQTFDVADLTPPVVTPPAPLSVGTNVGATYEGVIGTATATDNVSSGATLPITNNAPAAFPLGDTIVIWTATDASGNAATATQLVTVSDDDPPTIVAPEPLTVGTNVGATYVGPIGTATASDNVSSGVALTITSDAPATFPIGNTTVTWKATDAAGNFAIATQMVTVSDDDAPSITAPGPVSVGTNVGATYVGPIGTATASDNVSSGAALAITSNAPAVFPLGNTTVTWTATDAAGNFATATQMVTVTDDDAPSITAPGPVSVGTNVGDTYVGPIGTATASDNVSSGAALEITSNALAAFPLGTTTVTWTATDAAGNVSTATQVVTVTDDDAPSITAPGPVSVGTNVGATYVGPIGTATASDNVSSGAALVITSNAPGAFPLGTTTVTWKATDAAGNFSTATQVVTVEDDDAPSIAAPSAVTVGTNSGATYVDDGAIGTATASDNVPTGLVITNDAPAPFTLGTTTVTWKATDAAGNFATATQLVTVVDDDPPSIMAPEAATFGTNVGATYVGPIGTATASDNASSGAALAISNDAPSIFPLGNTTVTWTVADASGNASTAVQVVTVADDDAPSITAPSAVTVGTNSGATYEGTIGTATASDNVPSGLVITNDAPPAFPLGNTTVTWKATDAAGNFSTATQIVTVVDDDAPSITAPSAVTVGTNSGATYEGTIGTATASDNVSSGLVITNDAPPAFPLGNTTVTWKATDAAGNFSTATQIVTVVDDDAPSITAPSGVTVGTNSGATYEGAFGTATASDNVSSGLVITNDAPPAFPLGNTTVTWKATDAAGNFSTATQIVTVVDDDAPGITAPSAVTVGTNSGATYEGAIGTATASDNVPSGLVITNDAPAAFNVGNTTVTWTATDAAGNVTTATQVVTVVDDDAPTIAAPTALSVGTNVGATYVGAIGTATASDNVSSGLVITNNAPAAFPLGNTTVIWKATDAAGNFTTATQVVTVADDDTPSITAPAATSKGTNVGATYVGAIGTATASDNVSSGLVITNNAPAAFPLGNTTVTWKATDAAGNSSTATQVVTVVDDDAPSITAPASTSKGTNVGATFVGAIGTATASDNVSSAAALVITNNAPAAFPLGNTTVTWKATDAAGNFSTATQVVTVVDDDAPVVTAPANVTTTTTGTTPKVVTYSGQSATDNVGVSTLTCSPASGSAFAVGTTIVTCSAKDAAGNTGTATFSVTVNPTGSTTVGPGQTVTFNNGTIGGNVTLAGGTLILTNGTQVGGNIQGNGNVTLSGGSTVDGNLQVGNGNITITGGASVDGNLQFTGNGSVTIGAGRVDGNLQITGGGRFSIGPGAILDGNFQVSNQPVGGPLSTMCGAVANSNVQFQNNRAPINIGSTPGCAGNSIDGNLQINDNTAQIRVFSNHVDGNLQCSGNGPITGAGNTARNKQGQCSAF